MTKAKVSGNLQAPDEAGNAWKVRGSGGRARGFIRQPRAVIADDHVNP
jgi:hypothetical protein